MEKEIKFTDDEVKQINDLRIEVTGIFTQMGQVQFQKEKKIAEFTKLESDLHDRHEKLVTVEETLYKTLNEKYGDGNYDPETGVFTPNPDIEVE